MTEKQFESVNRMSNYFWLRFSQLVAESLDMVSPEMEDEALMTMQDHASVYGSDWERFRSALDPSGYHKNKQDWSI